MAKRQSYDSMRDIIRRYPPADNQNSQLKEVVLGFACDVVSSTVPSVLQPSVNRICRSVVGVDDPHTNEASSYTIVGKAPMACVMQTK